MQKINMIGGGIQHDICSSAWNRPVHVEWVKDRSAPISIHIDRGIAEIPDKRTRNFAWILESSSIVPDAVNYLKANIARLEENFELIFTFDKRLLSLSTKMRWCLPNACPWVQDRRIHPKSKLVSMVASAKAMCAGHLYRQEIVKKFHGKVDHYGWGYKRAEKKEDALKDYYFSINMENEVYPTYFTEKITDCFATGTIPVFWGTDEVNDFFNPNGIIFLDDKFSLESLSVDLYMSKMDAIKDNFERCLRLPTAEDFIYLNYLK